GLTGTRLRATIRAATPAATSSIDRASSPMTSCPVFGRPPWPPPGTAPLSSGAAGDDVLLTGAGVVAGALAEIVSSAVAVLLTVTPSALVVLIVTVIGFR